MKGKIKKWWFWIIISAIIIIGIIFIISNKSERTAGISLEEFDEIQIGKTTNWGLSKIIDKNNKWSDNKIYAKYVETIEELKEDKKYTYVYKYRGEKRGYAIITLQADYSNGNFYNDVIVIKKQKFDLK